jgi:hypothetical protein
MNRRYDGTLRWWNLDALRTQPAICLSCLRKDLIVTDGAFDSIWLHGGSQRVSS